MSLFKVSIDVEQAELTEFIRKAICEYASQHLLTTIHNMSEQAIKNYVQRQIDQTFSSDKVQQTLNELAGSTAADKITRKLLKKTLKVEVQQ